MNITSTKPIFNARRRAIRGKGEYHFRTEDRINRSHSDVVASSPPIQCPKPSSITTTYEEDEYQASQQFYSSKTWAMYHMIMEQRARRNSLTSKNGTTIGPRSKSDELTSTRSSQTVQGICQIEGTVFDLEF